MNGEGDAELTERAGLPGLVHVGTAHWPNSLVNSSSGGLDSLSLLLCLTSDSFLGGRGVRTKKQVTSQLSDARI